MFMIVYRKRYTGLNIKGHQDRVKGEILCWPMGPCYLNTEECIQTKQKMHILLNVWPITIAETMVFATKSIRFS